MTVKFAYFFYFDEFCYKKKCVLYFWCILINIVVRTTLLKSNIVLNF